MAFGWERVYVAGDASARRLAPRYGLIPTGANTTSAKAKQCLRGASISRSRCASSPFAKRLKERIRNGCALTSTLGSGRPFAGSLSRSDCAGTNPGEVVLVGH